MTTWPCTALEYSLANRTRFLALTWPFSIALNSSAGDICIAFAIMLIAPGRESPSCCESSSAWILPFDIICSRALKTRFCSSADNLKTRLTSDIFEKTKNVSSADAPPERAATANREYPSAAPRRLVPKRSASASTILSCRETSCGSSPKATAIRFVTACIEVTASRLARASLMTPNRPT